MDAGDIAIAKPCKVDWRTMTPAEGGRFCAECKKVVRNLSQMTEREARALLSRPRNEELCVRYLYDQKGKIFFAGELTRTALIPPSFLDRAKRAAAAMAVPLGLAACSTPVNPLHEGESQDPVKNQQQPPQVNENMGGAPAYPPDHWRDDAGADAASDASDGGAREDGGDVDGGAPDGGPTPPI